MSRKKDMLNIIINRIISTFNEANLREVEIDNKKLIAMIMHEYGIDDKDAKDCIKKAKDKINNLNVYIEEMNQINESDRFNE